MDEYPESRQMYEDLEPIVRGLGYCLVDCAARTVQRRFHIHLVIHRPEGVGIDDCTAVHKTVRPRVELGRGFRR